MGWWDEIVETVTAGAFWTGILIGFVLCVVVAILVMTYVPAPSPSRAALREQERQRVYRGWCAEHGWCPEHDVPDGQCPPVEQPVKNWHLGLGLCPGSASVVVSEDLAEHWRP
jgi:hypothetical protein